MQVGSPFNPYKVFQGIFAPYWLLEHRGISTGAKLCYIRLLGFAGKDARCYPSLEKLGQGLGVSDRQARDYVKELERAGLIAVEQRGLPQDQRLPILVDSRTRHALQCDPGQPGGSG